MEVNIIDDDLVEGPEMFRLILNTDEFSIPDVDTTTVTINDNDGKLAGVECVGTRVPEGTHYQRNVVKICYILRIFYYGLLLSIFGSSNSGLYTS